jgi:hypothetical protein
MGSGTRQGVSAAISRRRRGTTGGREISNRLRNEHGYVQGRPPETLCDAD